MCNAALLSLAISLVPLFSFFNSKVQQIGPIELSNPRVPWPLSVYNEYREASEIPLTEESVIHAATNRTGLNYFGDEYQFPFRNGLRVLLSDATQDSKNMSAFGKAYLSDIATQAVASRLQMHDLLARHPEIMDEEIDRPVWIIGTPRSGSTHLHRTLSQHKAFRAPKHFELLEPVLTDSDRQDGKGKDARWTRCKTRTDLLKHLRPKLSMMHWDDVDDAVEEPLAMMPMFRSPSFANAIPVRQYLAWYLYQSKTEEFQYLEMVLKVLQWQDVQQGKPRRRWILRAQPHTPHLPFLWRVFPSAELVHLHRDPVAVTPAYLTLLAYSHGIFSKHIDLHDMGEWWVSFFDSFLHKAVGVREFNPDEKVLDVQFADLVEDDLEVVKRVLEFAEEEANDADWQNMKNHIANNERYRDGHLEYDLSTFNLHESDLRLKFDFYREHFHVPKEAVKETLVSDGGHDEL
ncbi:hypothetical protein BSKO_04204 [Bryopsis sp. KO-2023]|nr:hypothetical protein BSKO_04204 [Bryopsis sp. KO-2023]